MTDAEYLERNLKGFEGDTFMREKFVEIIKRRKIDLVIETGTYLGGTTNQLRQMAKNVITIEVNKDYFSKAYSNIEDHSNVQMILGDSPEVLNGIFENNFTKEISVLMLLDAHWMDACPLKQELAEIAKADIKPVIVIHDFLVPGTDFGFDSYNGQPFTYEWLKPYIDNIYGEGKYKHYYNKMATGAKRGILYVEPK